MTPKGLLLLILQPVFHCEYDGCPSEMVRYARSQGHSLLGNVSLLS